MESESEPMSKRNDAFFEAMHQVEHEQIEGKRKAAERLAAAVPHELLQTHAEYLGLLSAFHQRLHDAPVDDATKVLVSNLFELQAKMFRYFNQCAELLTAAVMRSRDGK
jgi:hypothetical protein